MAPNISGTPSSLFLAEAFISPPKIQQTPHVASPVQKRKPRYQKQIVWRNVIAFLYLHIGGLYGLYLFLFHAHFYTLIWYFVTGSFGAVGVTAGAHRLWAHKAYKAKWPMRVFLAVGQTLAFQNHIYEWVRDHRVHHKFTDTDADPHNSKRGFFFCHIGWLMLKKHKDVKEKGKTVDMSDMEQDWVVMFQKKYYLVLLPLFCFVIPVWVPCYFWNESFNNAWFVAGILRYVCSLNFTWFVNSIAHIWGMKPYDRNISAVDSKLVAFLAYGEGWHNYHHVFPWDYKAAELGNYRLNLSTALIDLFAKLGLAYDLKTASHQLIEKRILRTGDGSHPVAEHEQEQKQKQEQEQEQEQEQKQKQKHHHEHENAVWGWDDEAMSQEEKDMVIVLNSDKKNQ